MPAISHAPDMHAHVTRIKRPTNVCLSVVCLVRPQTEVVKARRLLHEALTPQQAGPKGKHTHKHTHTHTTRDTQALTKALSAQFSSGHPTVKERP